jgi:transposase-like protein
MNCPICDAPMLWGTEYGEIRWVCPECGYSESMEPDDDEDWEKGK